MEAILKDIHPQNLEPCAGGSHDVIEFDTEEYLSLPFHITFGEGGAGVPK